MRKPLDTNQRISYTYYIETNTKEHNNVYRSHLSRRSLLLLNRLLHLDGVMSQSTRTFRERLTILCAKVALYGYLALTIFALGYFTTIYSDGILFEIDGIISYWIDFGGNTKW